MKSCFHFRTAAMVQVNRGCVSNLSCTDHAWYICNIEIISLAEHLRGRHHSCHPAREGDITNCLPARDGLSANENDCIILKDDNTFNNKSTVNGLVFCGSVFYLRDLLTLTVASKLSAAFLLGQEL